MFDSKEYRKQQKDYFDALRTMPGDQFNKYVVDYLQWKIDSLYKAYRSINAKMDDSEAKAYATRIDGAITAMDEVLKRIR